MNFDSPARKKRRRSTFLDRQSILCENEVEPFNSFLQRVKNEEIRKYVTKLKNEKEEWIRYEKTLRKKLQTLQSARPSDNTLEKINYMAYLSEEDKVFLTELELKRKEFIRLSEISLPKLLETNMLHKYEYEKQVAMERLLFNNFELYMERLQESFCSLELDDDFEILAPDLYKLNEDSTLCDEPFLVIEEELTIHW